MRRSWAEVFRNEALVLIEEERFAPLYSPDMGRPNRAVQTVLGVLVLKEMFDLTDMEALEELEFNLLWHHALRLEMEEAHLAQKTLHNFDSLAKVCAGRIRTNVPTPGYNIQSLFRMLPNIR